MTTPLLREMMSLSDDPTAFHWFDATGGFHAPNEQSQSPLVEYRPPFEKCMVVFEGVGGSGLNVKMLSMIVGNNPAEGIIVTVWRIPFKGNPVRSPSLIYLVDDGVIRYGPTDGEQLPSDKEVQMILGFVSAWLSTMSQKSNAYRPTVKDTFTNKRKVEAGKLPTYDWHTVVIEPAKPKSESKGGTHASPRAHDRRGHLRRLRNGGHVWVRDCKVGNAALGAVFKDYVIGEPQ